MEYKNVGTYTGAVCFSIRYFISDGHYKHFATLEEAKQYIDNRKE